MSIVVSKIFNKTNILYTIIIIIIIIRRGLTLQANFLLLIAIFLNPEGSLIPRVKKKNYNNNNNSHNYPRVLGTLALLRARVPSSREPAGLFRTDGKRPDGATLVPWSAGKYLAWDATVVHTCAASYISPQAASVGPASVQAANRK